MPVNIQDAKTHFSQYIERVEGGEIIVVCRHNKAVAELRPIQKPQGKKKARVAGVLKGKIQWTEDCFAPMTDDELALFE